MTKAALVSSSRTSRRTRTFRAGKANVKHSPLRIAPATSPHSVSLPVKLQGTQCHSDKAGHSLGTKKYPASAEPIGHDSRPWAEYERAGELRAGGQSDRWGPFRSTS